MHKLRKGFTLVELIIVLAIAGLVITLVFMAASAAQKTSRDTKRRTDAQKLSTAIEQWASNHNGALPIAAEVAAGGPLFTEGYLDASRFKDPTTGGSYTITYTATDPTISNPACQPPNMYYVRTAANPNIYMIVTCLEDNKNNKLTP